MKTLLQDLRYGLRILVRNPIFAVASITALALGVGAISTIFSVVNSVLLRPLPYADPERLVMVWDTNARQGWEKFAVSPANFRAYRERSQSFAGIAAFQYQGFNVAGAGNPERLQGALVSASLFPTLGVRPVVGRPFGEEEDRPGANRVVVISHGLWQRRFGADPNVAGKTLLLDNEGYMVVGVMPPDFQIVRGGDMPAGFEFSSSTELWVPLGLAPGDPMENRHFLHLLARLKPGVAQAQAQAEMENIARRLAEENPEWNKDYGVLLVGLREQVVGKVRPSLYLLLGAVAFVLLIACANVANLLLSRAVVRRNEIAVRMALGASRSRLVRQLLTESVLLFVVGGGLGLLFAYAGLKLLVAFNADSLPRATEIGLDWRVLGFALLVSLVTGLAFGLAPSLQGSKQDTSASLKESGGRGATGTGLRTQNVLIVAEVALAVTLLIGAGLMIKSFLQLGKVGPGFDPDRVLTMQIALPETKYPTGDKVVAFYRQLLERVAALPGVRSADVVSTLPLGGLDRVLPFTIEGRPAESPGDFLSVSYSIVSPTYFATMGIPVLKGRAFTDQDRGPTVVSLDDLEKMTGNMIIDEAMARRYWPNEEPVGKRLKIVNGPTFEIVGVVGGVRAAALDAEPKPRAYLPYLQMPAPMMAVLGRPVTLAVRTSADPAGLVSPVRDEVLAVDKDQPVARVRTMNQVVSESVAGRRFNMILLGVFAVIALVLAALGIYSIISYSVNQRTHEIGIRMALGAQRADILRLVVGQALKLTLTGLVIGLLAAFALTRLMSGLLFEVSTTDLMTFLAAPLFLAAVAVVASYSPALRAAKVEPMIALRHD
ncbi:MAG TPA: ABC transporter permease [Pyrinomonadaceae bacterium]|jgi:putative ABC transport system permease protein